MTRPRVITAAPLRRRPWGRTRGTIAVAALLLSAADHLAAALIGWPPVAYLARRIAAPLAEAWRAAAWRTTPPPAVVVTIRTTPPPERTPADGIPST